MNILLFLVNKFFPGLILRYFISKKQNMNTNNLIKMSIIIWITTFLTMYINGIDGFMAYELFNAYHNIFDESFYFPAFVLTLLFEITCLIQIKCHKCKVLNENKNI